MVFGQERAERDGERLNDSIGDAAVGIGITDGQGGLLLDVLMQQVQSLVGGRARYIARLMRSGTLARA